ncbi:MAG: glycosyl hydrolase family 18 protein [Flavobacteriales bacterium]|nr:glycosyl hydrolase family 18 protein [Flavobacteriales bacterium]
MLTAISGIFTACSKGGGEEKVEIQKITINNTIGASISVGEQLKLDISTLPTGITEPYTLEFTSSDKTVATVSSAGLVSGKGGGSATITVTVKEKSTISATYSVTVKPIYTAPENKNFVQVGYFPYYRTLTAEYIPDASLKMLDVACYAFAHIDENTLLPVVQQPSKLSAFVTRCHALGVKILISFSGSRALYVKMAADKTLRDKFADATIKIVKDYNLDGIDNDWEYPSTTDGSANGNLELMKRLSSYCHDPAENKLLTMAITCAIYKGGYSEGILDQLHQYVDWYNVMIYGWAAGESEIGKYPTVWSKLEMSYDYWITVRKMPTYKFVTGIGCYGNPSGISNTNRTLSYAGIVNQGNAKGVDYSQVNEATVESSSYPGQPFTIYYDGQPLVKEKTTWSMTRKLGGMMYWEVSQDKHDDKSLIKASNDAQGRNYR